MAAGPLGVEWWSVAARQQWEESSAARLEPEPVARRSGSPPAQPGARLAPRSWPQRVAVAPSPQAMPPWRRNSGSSRARAVRRRCGTGRGPSGAPREDVADVCCRLPDLLQALDLGLEVADATGRVEGQIGVGVAD